MTVFLSHSSVDAASARTLGQLLADRGIDTWIAPRDVAVGVPYAEAIMSAIQRCDTFVVLLTDAAIGSEQVLRELERAVHHGKRVCASVTDGLDLPPSFEYFLSAIQYLTVPRVGSEDALLRVAETVVRIDQLASGSVSGIETEFSLFDGDDPPHLERFCGRVPELEYLKSTDHRTLLITGLAGIGKTQLGASYLAHHQSEGRITLWKKIAESDSYESVIADLARLFHHHGLLSRSSTPASLGQRGFHRALIRVMQGSDALLAFDAIDDCVDQRLQDFWAELVNVARKTSVLFTSRTVPSWASEREQVSGKVLVLGLEGFTAVETKEFLSGMGLSISATTTTLVHERTGGHPLLLDLLASQIVSYELSEDDIREALPDLSFDLDQYLLTQIFRDLSAAELEVLRYLAVSFVPLTPIDLAAVTGAADRTSIIPTLRQLERRRLVRRVKTAFTIHSIVRDFTYQNTPSVTAMHGRLADLLASRAVASGRVVQEVVRHLSLSGRPDEADGYAIEHFGLLWSDGSRTWTIEALEGGVDRAARQSDERTQLRVFMLLGRLALEDCKWDEVVERYAAALAIAERLEDHKSAAYAQSNWAEVPARTGMFGGALELYNSAAVALELVGLERDRWVVVHNRASLFARYGRIEEAQEFHRTSLEWFDRADDQSLQAKAWSLAGLIAVESGDLEAALQACEMDAEICGHLGDTNGLARVNNNRAILRMLQGDFDSARSQLRDCLEVNRNLEDNHAVAQGLANLGVVEQEEGNDGVALRYYERALEIFHPIDDRISMAEIAYHVRLLQADAGTVLSRFSRLHAPLPRPGPREKTRFLWNVSYGYLP